MTKAYERLLAAREALRKFTDFVPETAVVLGSGLGAFADALKIHSAVDYREIDGFPVSTVMGHKGRFVFGHSGDVPVAVMQGRVHYYEGYSMEDVALPIRLLGMLGAKRLLLTNAAGAINENFRPGEFMVITDHISSFAPSPLIGENIDELGPRFPDMSEIYSKRLRERLFAAGEKSSISLHSGVYVQCTGPNYESPAEIRMYSRLGADAVGMSTACEATAANHMGLEVCGLSCLSNMAAGISKKPLSHEEVKEITDRVGPVFVRLVQNAVAEISK